MSGGLSGWNLLPQTPEALNKAVSRAVRKAAFDIQRIAGQIAPVDTGFLKASIYVVTYNSSTYSTAWDRANTKRDDVLLPEVDQPPDERTAYIAVGANYGLYVEMGTANMPARPYLTPAAEVVRPQYLAAMRSLEGPILSFLGGGGSMGISTTQATDEEPF